VAIAAGVEWGVHACITLSQADGPQPTARLAELHGVPAAYLAKQLQALARHGIIAPAEGRSGGYRLGRAADKITILDVVEAIDPTKVSFVCTEIRQRGPLAAPRAKCTMPCAIARAMYDAERSWRDSLAAVSIADLVRSVERDTDGAAFPALRTWLADR